MLARYRVHEMRVTRCANAGPVSLALHPVFRSLMACKTFYRQTCAKTSPLLLFWPCSMTASHSKTVSENILGQNHPAHLVSCARNRPGLVQWEVCVIPPIFLLIYSSPSGP